MNEETNHLECRKARLTDLDDICRLVAASVARMDSQGIPQWDKLYPTAEDFEEDIRQGEAWLITEADHPGLAAVFILSRDCDSQYDACPWTENNETWLVLHRFCVDASRQHRGLGSAALALAEDMARGIGAASIRLDAFSRNPFALRMYERAGYARRGTAEFRKGLFYLYEKRL